MIDWDGWLKAIAATILIAILTIGIMFSVIYTSEQSIITRCMNDGGFTNIIGKEYTCNEMERAGIWVRIK